jgi:predicted lipid-binding transport protein (Tim44 family)
VAAPGAMAELLYGGDESLKTRLVVRGAGVRRIRIAGVDVGSEPATMRVDVEVAGRWYIEDRDTAAVVSGSKDRASSWTERWTLDLSGAAETPWILRSAGQGASAPLS